MGRRLLNLATLLSTVLLGLTVIATVSTLWLDPWEHHLSIGADFHAGVWRRGRDPRLVLFSDREYGPYVGSIIGIVDAEGNVSPPLEREIGLGDDWGVYYRYFRWPDAALWTLMVSLYYPLALTSILPAVWLLRSRHLRAFPAGDDR